MYEPYPVPELAREHQRFRRSNLWTFAKQDLRLLLPVHIFKCMDISRR